MIDIQFLRDNPEIVKAACRNKNASVSSSDVDELLAMDARRRELQNKVDDLRRERNEIADAGKSGRPTPEQIERGKELKNQVAELETELSQLEADFYAIFRSVPNIPTADVPIGATEDENVIASHWGEVTEFGFEPKSHWELAEARDWIDKERAAKVAGARFAYIKGDLVRLQYALMMYGMTQLMDGELIAKLIKENNLNIPAKPFVPVLPPAMVRTDVYEATGRLNGAEVTYKLEDDDLWLNASAEHSLAPMYMGEIIDEKQLPIRYAGFTTAFRREAGTYGKDVEGILRLHQFDKLEMEIFCSPETSLDEHLLQIALQQHLMQELGLPHRVVMKCTADIGKPNARGVDIDVWLPSQNTYRETHTADMITDYQTRRLQTRVRRADGTVVLAHTNDATAFSQRPLIAILENYQQADGTVAVPKVLQKFYGGEVMS
jgi:seryl-tRNA synthetase